MKIKTILAALVIFSLFWACKKSEGPEYIVRKWMGKEIQLPDNSTYIVQGDTVQYDLSENDYNIIVYIDSEGCTECRMRMPVWNMFMAKINQYNKSVGLIFIVNDVDADKIAQMTKRNDFRYPVLLASENFCDFPEEHLYQSFLLDESNRITAIGNPISNESIAGLYDHILSAGTSSEEKESNHPNLTLSSKRIPLGTIHLNETRETRVLLKNNGESTLEISKIITSCHCTTVNAESDSIQPGKSVSIEIIQSNDSTIGSFARDVYIYFENNPYSVQIELTGFMPDQTIQQNIPTN
ncbi:MAG: DUF1573 domain-containing protein [Clostridium sp.]|nr:DUF1573 domain-containing protein [Clostridium sp.]